MFPTYFSYFRHYFHILVFLLNHYLLISLHLSRLHGNLISCPVSRTLSTQSWYVVHAPPYFWHRTRGFLEGRRSWEPGSRLTTGDFSPFHILPKGSGANVRWTNANHTFLTHNFFWNDTFSRDISPTKLRSTARVWNPHCFPNSWIRLIVGFLALCSKQYCGPSSLRNPS
jgi:hypothetical protein